MMTMRDIASLAIGVAVVFGSAAAQGDLLEEDSIYGPDTVTFDTQTGVRWLDLPLSAGYGHALIVASIGPTGDFAGYELATNAQIATLLGHAGIDVGVGNQFVADNHDEIAALADLIGTSGTNGNCGSGCSFSFTQGWTAEGAAGTPGTFHIAVLGWFDNTGGQAPSLPAAPLGRVGLGDSHGEAGSPALGAWLVEAPEADATALAAVALAALCALRTSGSRGRDPAASSLPSRIARRTG
jgi:hypothetical protein